MTVVPRWPALLLLAAVAIGLALVPVFGETYAIKVATRMIVFAIFAMSLDLLLGYTGLVSFGHAAFFGLAAYTLQIYSPEYEAVNIALALPVVIGVTAFVGALIGALVVRTSGIYFIMVTLAFAQMMFYFFHDSQIAGGSDGAYIWVKPVLAVGETILIDFEDRATLLWFALGLMLAVYGLLIMLLRSPFGQVIQGIKVNEHRMRALGYDTYRYKLVSYVISAAVASLAGFVYACIDGYISPELLGWKESGIGLAMVILGGMGTLFGPIVGAVAFIGVEELARERELVGFLADHFQIIMGCFVIAVVLMLRNGLAGSLGGAPRAKPDPVETEVPGGEKP
ncbi:branched-chain amino acid ABC transporter permease [Marivibrio halodurans]|uniref:Branched-chain amino acid ABC transporter permease n=1 Tax=Marivibrio halodurans TaxID=2039722 RepID=A0A8J7V1Z9_9PROT|nr:branched-chain amino acid ABC transporter permease [Marivibrio halodurans]MBP5856631.1 branched-chain amino acid ABC transporter permease [Marivibrio halodurans]